MNVMNTVCGTTKGKKIRISTQPDALLNKLTKKEEKDLYDQYTIHPANSINPTSILEAYQMKRVNGDMICLFEKHLDLLCFPDLFPTGEGGRFSERPFGDLRDADYRVSRLLHKSLTFSMNTQYLFHSFYIYWKIYNIYIY